MATGSNILSEPHIKIIDANRVKILKKIDILGTFILDDLVEKGGLSGDKLIQIRESNATSKQRAEALIDHLYRRPHSDWLKFLDCLESENKEFADELRKTCPDEVQQSFSVPPATSTSASPSVSALASSRDTQGTHQGQNIQIDASDAELRHTLSMKMIRKFGINIWPEENEEVSLGKLYTDLVLTKRNSSADSTQVAEYTEIFKMDGEFHDGKDAFLYGKTAAGKTTLVRKIALDWAKLKCLRHSTTHQTGLSPDSDGWIKELTCVILLDLCKIKKRQNLAGAIEEQLEIEKEETAALVDLIRRNEMKTLLILDGLNTYNWATSTSITEIIRRQQMKKLTLLVTSRYPRSFHFSSKNQPPESEFILHGFSDDGIGYYTDKYVIYRESCSEKQASLKSSIIEKIMESSYLKEMASFPALLGRMVSLFKEPIWRSKNIAEIYEELVMYICGRCNQKLRESNCQKLKRIPMDLGTIAVTSVEGDGMREEFSYKEVMKVIDEVTWQLGFLYRKDTTTVSFINISIQQYFIAYYMANTNKQAQTEKLIKFCRAAEVLRRQELIFKFVSHMGDKELRTYMARIMSADDRKKVESQLRIRELNLD